MYSVFVKKICYVFTFIFIFFFILGCDNSNEDYFFFSCSSYQVYIGESFELNNIPHSTNITNNNNIYISIANESVAKEKDGIITPLSVGQTKVTVCCFNNKSITSSSFLLKIINQIREGQISVEYEKNDSNSQTYYIFYVKLNNEEYCNFSYFLLENNGKDIISCFKYGNILEICSEKNFSGKIKFIDCDNENNYCVLDI